MNTKSTTVPAKVSFYKNIADTKSNLKIDITDYLDFIKNGKYKVEIENLRSKTVKKEISEAKKTLPNITASGTFTSRIDSAIIAHSGLIQIDFDNVKDIVAAKAALISDPFIFTVFLSPTGKGLKGLVKIDPQQHNDIYPHLEQYFLSKYDLQIDTSCGNLSRAMFVSYDPDLFYNPDSQTFLIPENVPGTLEPIKLTAKTTRPPKPNNKADEVELLVKEIEAGKIDITGDYNQWLKIGFAIASEFGKGGEDFFHRVSCYSDKYSQVTCSEQYAECCKSKKGGATIATLFFIAQRFNILAHSPSKNQAPNPDQTPKDESQPATQQKEFAFYPVIKKNDDGEDVIKEIKVNWVSFINVLRSWGISRYDIGTDSIYILTQKNVIKQITKNQIQDFVIEKIKGWPHELENGVKTKAVIEKIFSFPQNYFSENRLTLLYNKLPPQLKTDTKNEAFFYFKNGYVICNQDNWSLHSYDTLTGHIWESQIIQRDFRKIDIQDKPIESSVIAQFMNNISGKNENKFTSLCSLAGYLLHGYTDIKLKAVILTDSKISKKASGRTGKTLWGYILGKIVKVAQINGKDFDPVNRWKYQGVALDDKIIFINDIKRKFAFESLFNDITEGISVEKKNQNPFTLKVKMFIATNETVLIEGGSAKDRCIEFEVANHYSDKFSPEDEFKQRFFSDWNKSEWQQFDNFMMYCVCIYLGNGIIEPENVNLKQRKLLDQTNEYFIEFMNDKIADGSIRAGIEFLKHELHTEFLDMYTELKTDTHRSSLQTFTKWIKTFAELSEHFDSEILERRSDKKRFFSFKSRNIK